MPKFLSGLEIIFKNFHNFLLISSIQGGEAYNQLNQFSFFLTLHNCISFAKYQNESATGIHVFPILNPPPSPYHPTGTMQTNKFKAVLFTFSIKNEVRRGKCSTCLENLYTKKLQSNNKRHQRRLK